ncbi:15765_t:CDS:2 [Rhizophagus irregularis]|nr:15765_t:CDS:2 [Rhizophagus irregularis]
MDFTTHKTFEFYLSYNTRIYRVTNTALNKFEIAQLLNNGINLSHIPGHHFPHHYYIQFLIRQFVESQIYQPNVQQQSFGFQPNSQVYSSDSTNPLNNNNNEPNILINDGTHINIASPAPQNTFEFYLPSPYDMFIYHVTYTELHSFEIAQLLNNNCIIQFLNHYNTLIQQQLQQQVQLSLGADDSS